MDIRDLIDIAPVHVVTLQPFNPSTLQPFNFLTFALSLKPSTFDATCLPASGGALSGLT